MKKFNVEAKYSGGATLTQSVYAVDHEAARKHMESYEDNLGEMLEFSATPEKTISGRMAEIWGQDTASVSSMKSSELHRAIFIKALCATINVQTIHDQDEVDSICDRIVRVADGLVARMAS